MPLEACRLQKELATKKAQLEEHKAEALWSKEESRCYLGLAGSPWLEKFRWAESPYNGDKGVQVLSWVCVAQVLLYQYLVNNIVAERDLGIVLCYFVCLFFLPSFGVQKGIMARASTRRGAATLNRVKRGHNGPFGNKRVCELMMVIYRLYAPLFEEDWNRRGFRGIGGLKESARAHNLEGDEGGGHLRLSLAVGNS